MNSHMGNSEKGMVLVLTLAILVLLTAMVTEFSYGVYIATSALSNWRDSQRLSFIARSGITLAVKTISDIPDEELFRFPGRVEIPVEKSVEGFHGGLLIEVEDENGKFNLNSIRSMRAYDSFKRLLKNLELNEIIADRVIDWIDTDNIPNKGFLDSEEGAKNYFFDSTDELLCLKGIDSKTYEKLLPYVTIYGIKTTDDPRISINTAPVPVIMSLDPGITKELAGRVLEYRKTNPFRSPGELMKVGFGSELINSITGMIITDTSSAGSLNFRIRSVSEENKIKRVIESVVEKRGHMVIVKYWKEY